MKKLFLIYLFLFSPVGIAQDNDRNGYQQLLFEQGQNLVKNKNYPLAIKKFTVTHSIIPTSEIAQIAIQKSDSLKSVLRKDKINDLVGSWKWISKDPSWAMPGDNLVAKMITITTTEILFYELYRNAKKWDLVKTEKIIFSDNPESYFFTELLYANNDIWEYNIKDSGELTAFYIGEKIENYYTQLVCGNPVFYYYKLK